MNFSSNTFLFMDTVINTTRIENGIRTEYEAIPINTECVIHGHIENGKLLIGAKLYTSKTIDELKSELEATSSPSSFAVLWVILTIVIAYAPTVYIANKSYKNNIVDISKTCKLKELEMTRIIDTYEPNVKKYRKITNEENNGVILNNIYNFLSTRNDRTDDYYGMASNKIKYGNNAKYSGDTLKYSPDLMQDVKFDLDSYNNKKAKQTQLRKDIDTLRKN